MKENPITQDLGVAAVMGFFAKSGWLFRELARHDFGVDALVEIVKKGVPTGSLIGIQIKSGESYFCETTLDSIVFRADESHAKYWLDYVLPVILVLYDPRDSSLYWENFSQETLDRTGKGWKIKVPKNKILSEDSLFELRDLTQPPSYIRNLDRLRLVRPWIELVARGEEVYVECEDWVNKSLPRYTLKIGCPSVPSMIGESWPTLYCPGLRMMEFLMYMLPWAEFKMDEETYRLNQMDLWDAECRIWDHDEYDDSPAYTQPFEEFYEPPEGICPVEEMVSGEVNLYRLILSLNDLGRSFLLLDGHLSREFDVERRSFGLD